jgi:hypothetical protein
MGGLCDGREGWSKTSYSGVKDAGRREIPLSPVIRGRETVLKLAE